MRSRISVRKQNLNFKEFGKFDEYRLNSVESVADMKILVGEIFFNTRARRTLSEKE